MAEEVPTELPLQAAEEQQPMAEDQPAAEAAEPVAEAAAEPVAAHEPATEAAAMPEQQDNGLKRTRDEEGGDADEPDAKRAAPADANVDGAEGGQPGAAAQTETATDDPSVQAFENGTDNPAPEHHNNPGPEGASLEAAAGDNPGHAAAQHNPGPPPVKDGFPIVENEDGSISEILAVSKHLVGKLIGKGGTTIQQLQAATATNIQIDQEGTEFADAKKVTVRGSTENVAKAKAAIQQMLEEAVTPGEGEVEERIPCPAGIVGRIIGRGGETIRSLQQGSGAHILVDQNFPEGADRMVVVKGRSDSVQRAAAMVNELIKGEPGSASQIISKHGVGSTLTLTCPKGIVGRIIGKGGETIKGLQRKYHVSIQIDQGGDPMTVTITGPKHTAEICKQEVQALISDTPGPGGPPFGGPGPRPGFPRPGYGPPFGGPAPYQVPPAGFGGYGPPYGAPYGAPTYGAPGGYGGYPPQYSAGGYGAGAYGGASSYGGAAGYGSAPAATGGYGQQTGGYGGPASGGYSSAPATAGGYGQQQAGYGGAAAGGYGSTADTSAAGGYGGQTAAAGGAASGAAAAASSSSVWQAMQDDQGRTYYYNSQTGVSQWEKPADMA